MLILTIFIDINFDVEFNNLCEEYEKIFKNE